MIDISEKEIIKRSATAYGEIHLKPSTIESIRNGEIKKGDVIGISKVAGISGAKITSTMLPLCHQIPLDDIEPIIDISGEVLSVKCTVKAHHKTGVEMEALVCVSTALLNAWDMVKYLEKDESGNYPTTRITNLGVLEKRKG